MDVSRHSWHRKYITWIYHEKVDAFAINNLCAYFWLALATFVFTPAILVAKGILALLDRLPNEPLITSYNIINYTKQAFFALALIAYILVGIYTGWIDLLIITGACAGTIFLTLCLGFVGVTLIDKYKESRAIKSKKSHMSVEWIKAKKNKYCPRLNWVD